MSIQDNDKPVYVLLKNFAHLKSGREFVKNDEYYFLEGNIMASSLHKDWVEDNPEWFQLKDTTPQYIWQNDRLYEKCKTPFLQRDIPIQFQSNSNEQSNKDYTITAYYKMDGNDKTVYNVESYGRLHPNKIDTSLPIYQVRRSLDNEVFTIGDEVTVDIYFPIPVKIKSFSQSSNQGVCFFAEDDNNEYFLPPFYHTKKQKPEPSTPLFTEAKMYTEEDLRKCFNAANFVIPEPQAFEKYLQSLSINK